MEVSLPVSDFGSDIVAIQMGRSYTRGGCKTDVKFCNKRTGRTYSVVQSPGKNRLWLRVKLKGRLWHVGRLVAWSFSNPRNLSWETFMQKGSSGYKYQALHISLDETDFRAANLVVGTRRQNWLQYQAEAKAKHNRVVRYTCAEKRAFV